MKSLTSTRSWPFHALNRAVGCGRMACQCEPGSLDVWPKGEPSGGREERGAARGRRWPSHARPRQPGRREILGQGDCREARGSNRERSTLLYGDGIGVVTSRRARSPRWRRPFQWRLLHFVGFHLSVPLPFRPQNCIEWCEQCGFSDPKRLELQRL